MLQIFTSENIFTLENFLTFFFQMFFFQMSQMNTPQLCDVPIRPCFFIWSPEGETFVFEFVRPLVG